VRTGSRRAVGTRVLLLEQGDADEVIGLTKSAGGGREYAALILSICATRVWSPGIQLPITMRPPGRITRIHATGFNYVGET
jgi:hypothetical protein